MFREARQSRTFEDVMLQIQEAILEGSLKEGDRLPSERALEETFKVSRGTLREALRGLEQRGFVVIKTGVRGGAFVRTPGTKTVTESLDILLRYQKISVEELEEFREEVEGLVAAKAAEKATDEDVRHLYGLLKSIEGHLPFGESRREDIFKLDEQFHLTLVRIVGNKMYESVLNSVYANISRYFERFLPADARILVSTHEELCEIAAAIEKRDANAARLSLQKHVKRYYWMMVAQKEQTK